MERISEVLFAVIMALTFTNAIAVGTAGNAQVRTMLLAALGCNLAWGIIDGCLYVMGRINAESGKRETLKALRDAPDGETAKRVLAETLHPALAAALSMAQVDAVRDKLRQMPALPRRTGLTREDALGALGTCLLCFLSTLPIALPFLFIGDTRAALAVSNMVAAAMLLLCGYAFGLRSDLRPWPTAFAMVVLGGCLIGIAIVLGG